MLRVTTNWAIEGSFALENAGDHVAIIRQCRLFSLRLLHDSRSAQDVLPGLAHNSTTLSETGRKTVSIIASLTFKAVRLLIYFYAIVSSRSLLSLIMCCRHLLRRRI